MTVKTHTKVQNVGIAEGADQRGLMEYGYGLYVNAYVVDTEFAVPESDIDGNCGMYATERVPFDADDARISRARRRVRVNARRRYLKDKASV